MTSERKKLSAVSYQLSARRALMRGRALKADSCHLAYQMKDLSAARIREIAVGHPTTSSTDSRTFSAR